jgi:hypothetical protein
MTSRGDVNVALNRLIREGVLTAFRTNFDQAGSGVRLQVTATAPLVADPAQPSFDKVKLDQTRLLVQLALGDFGRDAVVIIEGRQESEVPAEHGQAR